MPVMAKIAVVVQAAPQGSETVLVVEDEGSVGSLVRGVLEEIGYTVLLASRPSEALLICQGYQDPIHLLYTDVVMPQMNGPELAKRLVALRPEMKVLYMSGYTDEAIIHHGVREPGVPFLQRPFTPAAVACKAWEVLDTATVGIKG